MRESYTSADLQGLLYKLTRDVTACQIAASEATKAYSAANAQRNEALTQLTTAKARRAMVKKLLNGLGERPEREAPEES